MHLYVLYYIVAQPFAYAVPNVNKYCCIYRKQSMMSVGVHGIQPYLVVYAKAELRYGILHSVCKHLLM